MRLVTFSKPGADHLLGAIAGDRVLDLLAASEGDQRCGSMLELIRSGRDGKARVQELLDQWTAAPHRDAWHDLTSVQLRAPIPRPAKNVFCVGLNYRSHVEQNAIALGQPIEIPTVPLFFSKPVTAVVGPGGPILCDSRLTVRLDYEVELAVIIGTPGTWLAVDDVASHIFGYTLINDVSARDLQWRTSQFLYGKGLDSYCPMGPAIVTTDEMPPLRDVIIELYVNDELRQRESAGQMIFSPAEAIAELSRGITLEAGDVISLGTPGGCGYQMVPPRFLQPGDRVECRSEFIGSLVNPVIDPTGSGEKLHTDEGL